MHLSSLDSLIRSRTLLEHPFYKRWSAGKLTKDELKIYAKEYFHLVERVPGIVERVRDRVQEPAMRARIDQNVVEEQEHVELWKRFAKSLGISERELTSYEPSAMARKAVASIEKLVEESADAGISAVYAMELELPAIAATKKQGLCDFYGLTSDDAHAYFDEHLCEEEHLKVWRIRPVDEATARRSATVSLSAQHTVLDAVCKKAGIPCDGAC